MPKSNSQPWLNGLVRLVDDEEDVLESLTYLLKSEGIRSEAFTSAEAFLQTIDAATTGCIVLDYLMPQTDGVALQKLLIEKKCDLPVLFLTAHADVDMAIDVFRNGAADVLRKPVRPEEFLSKVRDALERDYRKRAESEQKARALLQALTTREEQILRLATEGLSNALIAERLSLSERTVEAHRNTAYHKLHIRSIPEFAALRQKAGGA